jgi:hypothetical protein
MGVPLVEPVSCLVANILGLALAKEGKPTKIDNN